MNNVTLIDDLPELNNLEFNDNTNSSSYILPAYEYETENEHSNFTNKFIRNNVTEFHDESGMSSKNTFNYNIQPLYNQHNQHNKHNQHIQHNKHNQHNLNNIYNEHNKNNKQDKTISCIDVWKHIENCPICSKHYKQDNTILWIVIIILFIICLLLLYKLLDKE